MRVPVWLTLGVAALVVIFGVYRIRLAFRSNEEDARARARKGLYGLGRRTHALVGIVYLLLGTALIATSFGWSPVSHWFGPPTAPPRAGDAARRPGSIRMPIDNLPRPTSGTPTPAPVAPATPPGTPTPAPPPGTPTPAPVAPQAAPSPPAP